VAGAFRRQVSGWNKSDDVARGVDFDRAQADFAETFRKPLRARLLLVGRRGDRNQLRLSIHDGLGVAVQPREGGVNRALRGERGHLREGRVPREKRHASGFRVAGMRVERLTMTWGEAGAVSLGGSAHGPLLC